MADILTVMWKERKGLFRIGGSRSRTLLTLLTPVVMIGIIFPLMQREEWFTTAFSLVAAIIIPFILVATAIPESFAGERERHTLSTLLASRLPDHAILFGKMGLAIAYGWIATLILLAVSVVVANLVIGDGQIHFFPPILVFANVVISLLVATLLGTLGVLVSLRSPTVQGAQQMLFAVVLIPGLVLQVAPMLLMSVVPNGREIMSQILEADFAHVIIVMSAFLGITSIGLFFLVLMRFQRAKLILS